MLFPAEIREYQTSCFSPESLNLILPDLGSLRRVLDDPLLLFFRKSCIIVKRKEPMYPAGFWFFFQLFFNFLWRVLFPFR